ncbi:MAG TPA: hypothetical protein V6D29_02980 [Leptolyngbyaceae cyanobacterium]
MAKLLVALIPALWVVLIAIVSVQNATPVSLQFLGLRSIEIPFGVVLAFFAATSMVVTALLLPVLSGLIRTRSVGR